MRSSATRISVALLVSLLAGWVSATSSPPSKEQLELEKLRLEVEQLQLPWYRNSQCWFSGGALVLALIGAYITIRFQSHQSDLKIMKVDVESQKLALATEKAKQAQADAECERDKAVEEARNAEDRLKGALGAERKAIARVDKISCLMSRISALNIQEFRTPKNELSVEAVEVIQQIGDVMYDVEIRMVGERVTGAEGYPFREVEFITNPPGMQVILAGYSIYEGDLLISSHSLLGLHTNTEPPCGVTPFRTLLPVGRHVVKFVLDQEHQHSRDFEVT